MKVQHNFHHQHQVKPTISSCQDRHLSAHQLVFWLSVFQPHPLSGNRIVPSFNDTFRIGFEVLTLSYKLCNLNPGSPQTFLLTNFLLHSLDFWAHTPPLCSTNTSDTLLHPGLLTSCPLSPLPSSYQLVAAQSPFFLKAFPGPII